VEAQIEPGGFSLHPLSVFESQAKGREPDAGHYVTTEDFNAEGEHSRIVVQGNSSSATALRGKDSTTLEIGKPLPGGLAPWIAYWRARFGEFSSVSPTVDTAVDHIRSGDRVGAPDSAWVVLHSDGGISHVISEETGENAMASNEALLVLAGRSVTRMTAVPYLYPDRPREEIDLDPGASKALKGRLGWSQLNPGDVLD
jgi:hypothetical protein